MVKVVTVEQMRAIELASVRCGVSLDQLQRNAAAAVALEIQCLFRQCEAPALFLIGAGNNGRDGLIAAHHLLREGWDVRVYLMPKVGSEDILRELREGGVALHEHTGETDLALLRRWIGDASIIVDGLLGIGIRGTVREPIAGVISATNDRSAEHRVPVVAVDLPSGVDADTGEIAGSALRCDYTISLGCVKAGLLKFPAAEFVGELIPVDIGLPVESYKNLPMELLLGEDVSRLLPSRPLQGHKGTFGRALVVAGSANFVGAPYLVGAAAARAGCGLVTFAVPEWQRNTLATLLPEATYLPLSSMDDAMSAKADAQAVTEALPEYQVLAIGPGLGQGTGQSALIMTVLAAAAGQPDLKVVVDADGLNALAGKEKWWERLGSNFVLTPHPGEMSRLTGLSMAEIGADRWGIASSSAQRWGQTVVLKGAFSVIADPLESVWVSPFAIPALATAGTGDVLTGIIAGLMAQGATPTDAARAGVFLHAAAARRLLDVKGVDRLLAGDLLPAIPTIIADSKITCAEKQKGPRKDR